MGQGISTILVFAVAVAISPLPIIAVILMLFSQRARTNGLLFLAGWIVALSVVSVAAYLLADQSSASTSGTTSDTISWSKLVFGLLFLLLALRSWRHRPAPGAEPAMPKWMAGIDGLRPGRAFGLGVLLAGVNPKNLMLALAAGSSLALLGLPASQAAGSLLVFVLIASLSIGLPVVYYLVGGDSAEALLDDLKDWLREHNNAVMAVLFVLIGFDLMAKGLAPLT